MDLFLLKEKRGIRRYHKVALLRTGQKESVSNTTSRTLACAKATPLDAFNAQNLRVNQ